MNNKYKMNTLKALSYFIILWIIVGFGMVILPIQSKFGHDIEVMIICMVFVLTVSITAVFWYQNTPRLRLWKDESNPMSSAKVRYIMTFSTIASVLGNVFVAIDRIVFRGIDYSAGLRNARYQWLEGNQPGSFFGKIGNLLIPFAFCALYISIFHWERLSKRSRIIGLIVGFGGEFGLAMLNGGRSNILLTIEFAFAVCVIRQYHGKKLFPKMKGKLLVSVLVGAVLVRYVVSIFFAFSSNNMDYLYRISNMLGTNISNTYKGNGIMNVIIEIFIYMFHGINYIGAQIEYGGGVADLSHNMTLRGLMTILSRLPGVNYQAQLPVFDGGGGNFMALPGQILYDYTYFFYIPICIFIGIMAGDMLKVLNKNTKNLSCFEILFVITIMLLLYHSAIGMAVGFSYFFFMVFAIIAMEILSFIKFGKRSSWTIFEE